MEVSYSYEVRAHVEKIFQKLSKKNHKQLKIIEKKLEQILEHPDAFKPLRAPLQNCRAVHIDKSFVLVYSVDESRKVVVIEHYAHHDDVYKWRPLIFL